MEVNDELENFENVEKELGNNPIPAIEEEKDSNSKNITVTPVQQDIIKELAKIDIELEALEKITINEDEFYEKLDELLTDEEKYMQENEPKEYLKLIDSKKKEYLKNNSNEDKKNILLEQKKDLELKNAIEVGVVEVTAIYKDYKHSDMQSFFNNKLTKEEQKEILNSSKTTTDVFKKTYEQYLSKNGKSLEIKNNPLPNTPDLSKVTKQSIKPTQISAIDSEEEKYKKGLGV